jgi:FKBP-type peptidyl-prolyl cis-trans isomerase (trigger factor)
MSVKWEKQEGNEGVLTVEVDAETFKTALDDAFKKVVKQVSIPGFRKGKIPRGLIRTALWRRSSLPRCFGYSSSCRIP